MPGGDNPSDSDFEQASSRLNQGLKSCRFVVNNYRAILTGDHAHADNDDQVPQDGNMSGYVSTTDSDSESYEPGSEVPLG